MLCPVCRGDVGGAGPAKDLTITCKDDKLNGTPTYKLKSDETYIITSCFTPATTSRSAKLTVHALLSLKSVPALKLLLPCSFDNLEAKVLMATKDVGALTAGTQTCVTFTIIPQTVVTFLDGLTKIGTDLLMTVINELSTGVYRGTVVDGEDNLVACREARGDIETPFTSGIDNILPD